MRTRTKAAIAIAAAMALAATSHVYLSLEGADCTALWDAREAYFFVTTQYIGHRVNGLRFPWFVVENFLGGVEDPDDLKEWLDVIHVTSSSIEHHRFKQEDRRPGMGPGGYVPLNGSIYLTYAACGGICRWASDHFEAATPEERQRLNLTTRLTNWDVDHGENGWSKRSLSIGPGNSSLTFTVELGRDSELSVNSASAMTWQRTVSINRRLPGTAAEWVWDVRLRWWFVRRAEYLRIFQ